MKDWLGREIEYLRLSVTQDCNLNCIYCRPSGSVDCETACHGLATDELKLIVGAMAGLGIRKVRITGGEPLIRPDICEIIAGIAGIPGIEDISLTTNGIRLAKLAGRLRRAGLQRINISLDSLKGERFEFITGGGRLDRVLRGIKESVSAGLKPVKINAVLIRGVNDDEVDAFMELAREQPVEVRFIELMPVGRFGEENRDKIVYNTELIEAHPELISLEDPRGSGPAAMYTIKGYKGRIGFISPMSHRFCKTCNRIRLTCDGKIRLCLGHNSEVDITGTLREQPEELQETVRDIIFNKPEGHNFNRKFVSDRGMNEIGG